METDWDVVGEKELTNVDLRTCSVQKEKVRSALVKHD
jgi:hypothetical protein